MRYLSLLTVLVLLLGVGLAPKGARADDEVGGGEISVAMITPADTAVAALTDKASPGAPNIVSVALEPGGDSQANVQAE